MHSIHIGSPKMITTDHGTQFESTLSAALSQILGSERIRTTSHHRPSNGLIQKWHRIVKDLIRCHEKTDWVAKLPTALLGLRTCYKEYIKASAAEYLYGTTFRIPGQFFMEHDPPVDHQKFLLSFRYHMNQL